MRCKADQVRLQITPGQHARSLGISVRMDLRHGVLHLSHLARIDIRAEHGGSPQLCHASRAEAINQVQAVLKFFLTFCGGCLRITLSRGEKDELPDALGHLLRRAGRYQTPQGVADQRDGRVGRVRLRRHCFQPVPHALRIVSGTRRGRGQSVTASVAGGIPGQHATIRVVWRGL